jgi:hypothetical protein
MKAVQQQTTSVLHVVLLAMLPQLSHADVKTELLDSHILLPTLCSVSDTPHEVCPMSLSVSWAAMPMQFLLGSLDSRPWSIKHSRIFVC